MANSHSHQVHCFPLCDILPTLQDSLTIFRVRGNLLVCQNYKSKLDLHLALFSIQRLQNNSIFYGHRPTLAMVRRRWHALRHHDQHDPLKCILWKSVSPIDDIAPDLNPRSFEAAKHFWNRRMKNHLNRSLQITKTKIVCTSESFGLALRLAYQ
jgi:hypothetical protein